MNVRRAQTWTPTFHSQDPRGDAVVVGLYSSPWALVSPGPELDAIVPLGSTLIVREPYLKPASGGGVVRRCFA